MKIAIDIAPHEDGVHCGDCLCVDTNDPEKQYCRATGDRLYYAGLGQYRRCEACLAAEQEFANIERVAGLRSYANECARTTIDSLQSLRDGLIAERDAMKKALNGMCVYCAKAKPLPIPGSNLVGCEYLKERGITGIAGKRKDCPHWAFDPGKAGD